MPREDAKANKKRSRLVFERVSSVGRGRDRTTTIATTHREAAPKRGQRRETACVPTCVDVGWRRRRRRKKQATGEWNRPFSLRFPVFPRFRLLAVGMDATKKKRTGTRLSQHTHRTAGMGAKRPKGERRGIFFFIAKKKF
uniref:(northern house mosquito) hypothetical protein n=1 Tax=Culex pipiens TaxID=7175 RepID=A0A8D8BZB6_CULPI